MLWWQSLILGIVEGLTEYLPVSSTGHLILASRVLGLPETDSQKAFEVVIQFGAIIAVVGVYARAIGEMIRGVFGKSPKGLALAIRLIAAFAVTSAIALPLNKLIKEHLFGLPVVAVAWIVGGVGILVLEVWRRRRAVGLPIEMLTLRGALIIGALQAVALCPGVSRSLMTLAGGLLVGLSLPAALEFSFLLGGITLAAAAGHDAWKEGPAIIRDVSVSGVAIGLIAAAVAGFATVRWMIHSLERFGLAPFGYYRIVLGLIVLTLIGLGKL
ncbi:MAG: undecaprenyl-diphosphate phosphatase [Gemmataceae bacterium]